jgi:hypothetical protein
VEEGCAQHDTELLLGQAVPAQAWTAALVGRGLDCLSDLGTLQICTTGAMRAAARCGLIPRSVPGETPSCRVWGNFQCAEAQNLSCRLTVGSRQEKRPDLQQPERIAALGRVLLLVLLLGRLVARTLLAHVKTTGNTLPGGDKRETPQPTACMLRTKFSAVLVLKGGAQRPLAQPLATVQPPYLLALGVPATDCIAPQRGERDAEGKRRSHTVHGGSRRTGQREGGEAVVEGESCAPELTRAGEPGSTSGA